MANKGRKAEVNLRLLAQLDNTFVRQDDTINKDDIAKTKAYIVTDTIAEMMALSVENGVKCEVTNIDSGGSFTFDNTRVAENNDLTIYNGWVREEKPYLLFSWVTTGTVAERLQTFVNIGIPLGKTLILPSYTTLEIDSLITTPATTRDITIIGNNTTIKSTHTDGALKIFQCSNLASILGVNFIGDNNTGQTINSEFALMFDNCERVKIFNVQARWYKKGVYVFNNTSNTLTPDTTEIMIDLCHLKANKTNIQIETDSSISNERTYALTLKNTTSELAWGVNGKGLYCIQTKEILFDNFVAQSNGYDGAYDAGDIEDSALDHAAGWGVGAGIKLLGCRRVRSTVFHSENHDNSATARDIIIDQIDNTKQSEDIELDGSAKRVQADNTSNVLFKLDNISLKDIGNNASNVKFQTTNQVLQGDHSKVVDYKYNRFNKEDGIVSNYRFGHELDQRTIFNSFAIRGRSTNLIGKNTDIVGTGSWSVNSIMTKEYNSADIAPHGIIDNTICRVVATDTGGKLQKYASNSRTWTTEPLVFTVWMKSISGGTNVVLSLKGDATIQTATFKIDTEWRPYSIRGVATAGEIGNAVLLGILSTAEQTFEIWQPSLNFGNEPKSTGFFDDNGADLDYSGTHFFGSFRLGGGMITQTALTTPPVKARRGDVNWNPNPTDTGNIGWICYTTGDPADWRTFGEVADGGGGDGYTQEEIEDFIGAYIQGINGINTTYDDVGNRVLISLVDEQFTTALLNKLDAIEDNATADQTGGEMVTAINAEADANIITDAEKSNYDDSYTHSQSPHAPSNATVNDTDANLKDRANHTGTQAISTVVNLQDNLDLKVESDITGISGADQITNMVSLTQAEYDAITPNATTLYVIQG